MCLFPVNLQSWLSCLPLLLSPKVYFEVHVEMGHPTQPFVVTECWGLPTDIIWPFEGCNFPKENLCVGHLAQKPALFLEVPSFTQGEA